MAEPSSLWEQVDLLADLTPIHADAPPMDPGDLPGGMVAIPSGQLPATAVASRIALPDFAQLRSQAPPTAPKRLLILDTETTGLGLPTGQCIEVGAVLFHVPDRAALMQVSFLLPADRNPAEAVNGIPAAVTRLEQPWEQGLACFEAMVASADAVLAHNSAFDRQWFGHGPLPLIDKPWICSMEDIPWPPERRLRGTPSLRDLALAYGVPVWAAHRALTDVTYLVQVLERCSDLESLLQASLEPRRLYRADLGYSERHRAREAGFRWNDPVRGAWSRRLSEREANNLPFPVQPVDPAPLESAFTQTPSHGWPPATSQGKQKAE